MNNYHGYMLETADVSRSLPPIMLKNESSYLEEYARKNKVEDSVIEGIQRSILNAPK